MKIEIVSREGSQARYFVYGDDGAELKQVHREITADIAQARRQKRSLAAVIAESEGIEQPASVLPTATAPSRKGSLIALEHTHAEFSDVAEHAHPEYEHGHEHTHNDLESLLSNLAQKDAGLADALEALGRLLEAHRHPAAVHPHPDLEAQLDALTTALGRSVKHEHHHEHPPHSHEDLAERLGKIEQRLNLLSLEIKSHPHPFIKHEHDDKPHGHHELAQALADHIAESDRRTNARILSREEVGGKTRLILEEIG